MNLKDCLDLLEDSSAFTFAVKSDRRDEPQEVEFLDESGLSSRPDSFFVAGEEFGPSILIHARSFEDAWEAWIDNRKPIEPDELIEAYGIVDDDDLQARYIAGHGEAPRWGSPEWRVWHDGLKLAQHWYLANWEAEHPGGDGPELIEGYEYQANATGTGIVDVGHYSWMNDIDPSEIVVTRKAPEATEAKTATR